MSRQARAEHARSKAFGVRYTVAVQVNPHVSWKNGTRQAISRLEAIALRF